MNDYQAFVRTVCSPRYELSAVPQEEIVTAFTHFILAAQELDRIKRAIFYGKVVASEWAPDVPTRTVNFEHVHQDAFHGIIGICTEAGELAERLLLMAENADGDHRTNVLEELGDLDWYKTLLEAQLGTNRNQIQARNMQKLSTRYNKVQGFTTSQALERNIAAENQAASGARSFLGG